MTYTKIADIKPYDGIRAIAYDLDGVVANSLSHHYVAIKEVLTYCKVSIPLIEKMNEWWYSPYEERFKQLGVTLTQEKIREIYGNSINGKISNLFPHIKEVVKYLAEKDILLFIVTANIYLEPVVTILSSNGILENFTELKYGKENKEEFLIGILKKYSLQPREMIFIGDTKRDMISGVLAGVIPIGFDSGFGGVKNLTDNGAERIINDHREILTLLRF